MSGVNEWVNQRTNKYSEFRVKCHVSDQFSEGWERLSFPYVPLPGQHERGIVFLNLDFLNCTRELVRKQKAGQKVR